MKKSLIAVLFTWLIAFNPTDTRAQQVPFLSELLSRYEEFNRLYSEKQRAGANLSSLEPIRKQGEAAFKSGNIPAILESISQAIALLQGKQWDEKQKFQSSVTLETDRLVIEPNQDVQVSLSRMFASSLDKAYTSAPTVTFEIQPQGGPPGNRRPVTIADRLAIAEASTMANRRMLLADGAYWIVARVEAGGQKVIEIRKPIFAVSDFTDRITGLRKQLDAIKGSTDSRVKAVAEMAATPEFQLQRLTFLNRTRGEDDINVLAELDRIESVAAALSKGENPYSVERGEVERAYLASDGNLVPYRVYVPKSYDGTDRRPLVVMLHGALGDERSYFSGQYDPAVIKGEAERRGWIFASPNGRGRLGGYRGPGLEDVFEVIKMVTSHYKIDENRIYLTGHSMGGLGVWLVAAGKPDIFAAIAPVSGGGAAQSEALTALLQKLKAIPTLIVHGSKDGIVPPELSRNMVAAAQKAGVKASYQEVAGADHMSVVAATFPAVLDFFEKNSKQANVK